MTLEPQTIPNAQKTVLRALAVASHVTDLHNIAEKIDGVSTAVGFALMRHGLRAV